MRKIDHGSDIERAVVKSNSNEISFSVEETNAIRKKLGLKPLRLDDSKSKEERVIIDANGRARSVKDLAMMKQFSGNQQIGSGGNNNDDDEDPLVVMQDSQKLSELNMDKKTKEKNEFNKWLQGMQTNGNKSKLSFLGDDDEDDSDRPSSSSSARKGKGKLNENIEIERNVIENLDMDGATSSEGVIMTLKDEPIFDPETRDINTNGKEILENVDIVEKMKARNRIEQRYQSKVNGSKSLALASMEDDGIISRNDVSYPSNKSNIGSNSSEKEIIGENKSYAYANDYYTPMEEEARAAKKILKKKKKRQAENVNDTINPIAQTKTFTSLADELEEMANDTAASSTNKMDIQDNKDEVSQPAQNILLKPKRRREFNDSEDILNEDDELQLVLSKERNSKIAERKPVKFDISPIASENEKKDEKQNETNSDFLSDATNFATIMQIRLEERKKEKEAKAKGHTQSGISFTSSSINKMEEDEKDKSKITASEGIKEEADLQVDPTEAFLTKAYQAPSVKRGLADALAYVSQSRELSDVKSSIPISGRAKDKKPDLEDQIHRDPNDVIIEYKDEAGRVMTTKEAWRKLNYDFDGKRPGKKKMEKKQQALELERKRKEKEF